VISKTLFIAKKQRFQVLVPRRYLQNPQRLIMCICTQLRPDMFGGDGRGPNGVLINCADPATGLRRPLIRYGYGGHVPSVPPAAPPIQSAYPRNYGYASRGILTAAMGWVVEEEGGRRRKRQMVVSPLF
jgi:hypothetical protein